MIVTERVMHDPVDIRRRIDRLVSRVDRRDDYGQLLARGRVIYRLQDVDDIEAWRAEIKRQARADKVKVRTGFNGGIVWALLARAPDQDALVGGAPLPPSALACRAARDRTATRADPRRRGRRRDGLQVRPLFCAWRR
jgi:hypothetical protein